MVCRSFAICMADLAAGSTAAPVPVSDRNAAWAPHVGPMVAWSALMVLSWTVPPAIIGAIGIDSPATPWIMATELAVFVVAAVLAHRTYGLAKKELAAD